MASPLQPGLVLLGENLRNDRLRQLRDHFKEQLQKTINHISPFFSGLAWIYDQPSDSRQAGINSAKLPATAALIDKKLSDKRSVLLMNQAGALFIRQKHTPPLRRRHHHFKGSVTSARDVENLVKSICATLKAIVAVNCGGLAALVLATDDIKLVLGDLFQRILEYENAQTSTYLEWSSPVRELHGDGVGWVKYVIKADSLHESYLLSAKQQTEFDFEMYAYAFPTMGDLEDAYNDALQREKQG